VFGPYSFSAIPTRQTLLALGVQARWRLILKENQQFKFPGTAAHLRPIPKGEMTLLESIKEAVLPAGSSPLGPTQRIPNLVPAP
jgi:hypothetical protein